MTEDEIIENPQCLYAKHRGHCNRDSLLPYEYEFTCIACGYNVIKTKHELSKVQRKKINVINRLKYAEQKMICICIEVYHLFEGNDFDELYEVLSTLKTKKKLNKNKILIEKNEDMLEISDFERNRYTRTALGLYKNGNNNARIMKWLAY